FIGARAGYSTDSSIRNTFVGSDAGFSVRGTFHGYNSFFGASAGALLTSGQTNSFVGAFSAPLKISGDDNTYMGYQSGYKDSSGYGNTALGAFAGSGWSGAGTLSNNVFVGISSGYSCNANYNTFVGANAGLWSSTGTQNVFAGGSVLPIKNTTGSRNTFLGSEAGYENISGNNNSIIGYQADLLTGTLSNAAAIGAYARVDESNCMVLGGISGINGAPASTNVGIGTTTPHAALQFGNVIDNRRIVLWENTNTTTDFYGIGINSGTLRYQIPAVGNVHRFYAGNTLLFSIWGNGDAVLTGFLTTASDARLKKNITRINNTLDNLKTLNAYTYNWKDENKNQEQQIGLLAQEVEKVYPQLVKKDSAGLMSVNYSGFVPLLIKSMQEQQQSLDNMQKRMDLLEEQNKKLWQQLKLKTD
ncbi:MAG: tail fiber domain-containing protein, partial [Ferruginibacter sp.]